MSLIDSNLCKYDINYAIFFLNNFWEYYIWIAQWGLASIKYM